MIWFVHRNGGPGTPISFAAQYHQSGYNDEQIDDSIGELATFLSPVVHTPPTPRQWLERLSPATQLALETAALSNPSVSLWLRKATGNPSIDVTLSETIAGVAAMVSAGLLTAQEQTILLAP